MLTLKNSLKNQDSFLLRYSSESSRKKAMSPISIYFLSLSKSMLQTNRRGNYHFFLSCSLFASLNVIEFYNGSSQNNRKSCHRMFIHDVLFNFVQRNQVSDAACHYGVRRNIFENRIHQILINRLCKMKEKYKKMAMHRTKKKR